ncbi:hypothetical protein BKA57DRAFT_539711 [Linnemannia elongata]|nr:hypothetical protein BKA57DRAFT_539711 [Linnemannia elongata]
MKDRENTKNTHDHLRNRPFRGPTRDPLQLKLFFTLLALLTYKYRSHAIGTRRRPDLKEPKGTVPFFGHMILMASMPSTDLYDYFERTYRELGPVWSISLPGIGRMIQGDTPEMLEHVLKTNFWAYHKGSHFTGSMGDVMGKVRTTTQSHSSAMHVENKVAIITEASSGFGKALAERLVGKG